MITHFIDGPVVPGIGERDAPVFNPATGRVPSATAAETDGAIAVAKPLGPRRRPKRR